MNKQQTILEEFYISALNQLSKSFVQSRQIMEKIEFVCRCTANKAPIRFLLSCLLAKIDNSEFDIRKPYTEIGGGNTFSGRYYDERFIEEFVRKSTGVFFLQW